LVNEKLINCKIIVNGDGCYNKFMHRILIIEDDPTIREALEYNLRAAGFNVATAADGRDGLEKALAGAPDVILLDLLLPGMGGLAVCEELRRRASESRIIMITALGTDADKVKGLTVGADDYMTKPFNLEELTARIRAQLRRTSPAAKPQVFVFGDVRVDALRHELTVGGRAVNVRPKEWRLLMTLAASPGVLFSREQLADLVWGTDFIGSSRTIDVHIRRLREKVEGASGHNFIQTVHGLGYRFELTPKATAP